MEEVYAACMTYEPGLMDYVDFNQSSEPVWILGKKYNTLHNAKLELLRKDIHSRLWFTYRKQFSPIGDSGLTSDAGWGCMLRCGQMVMGQALLTKYLGRDWLWEPEEENPTYFKILKQFNDKENCTYSIHQIALKGATLGKSTGQWFGPNTVAQVLKKLAANDEAQDVVVHVAMDNMVFINDIKKICKDRNNSTATDEKIQSCSLRSRNSNKNLCEENGLIDTCSNTNIPVQKETSVWKPLVLFIPLRLGLSEINPVYFEKVKVSFTFKESLGIIGGRPNHALYFIGYTGDELVFLDPHTTQLYPNDGEIIHDSYHCQHAGRMNINQLDPSVALCFYCDTEEDFDNWCSSAQKLLLEPEKEALFELMREKPPHLLNIDIEDIDEAACINYICEDERKFDTSDDEYELLL